MKNQALKYIKILLNKNIRIVKIKITINQLKFNQFIIPKTTIEGIKKDSDSERLNFLRPYKDNTIPNRIEKTQYR